MFEVLVISYMFLALSSLLMLRAKSFTKLYPLSAVSSIFFILSALISPYFDILASISIYLVVYFALRNGFLTYSGFRPLPFDARIITFGLILIVIGFMERLNVAVIASRIVLANTFAIMALSRVKTPIRVGDYEILTLISLLFLSDGIVYVLKPLLSDIASVVDVHILYTSSLLFLLTMIRRS